IGVDKGYSFHYVGPQKLAKNSGKHPCYVVTLAGQDASARNLAGRPNLFQRALELLDQEDPSSHAAAVEVLGDINSKSASHHLVDTAINPEVDHRLREAALINFQDRGDKMDNSDIEKTGEAFSNETTPVEIRAMFLFVLGATRRESVFTALGNAVTNV